MALALEVCSAALEWKAPAMADHLFPPDVIKACKRVLVVNASRLDRLSGLIMSVQKEGTSAKETRDALDVYYPLLNAYAPRTPSEVDEQLIQALCLYKAHLREYTDSSW